MNLENLIGALTEAKKQAGDFVDVEVVFDGVPGTVTYVQLLRRAKKRPHLVIAAVNKDFVAESPRFTVLIDHNGKFHFIGEKPELRLDIRSVPREGRTETHFVVCTGFKDNNTLIEFERVEYDSQLVLTHTEIKRVVAELKTKWEID